jgi:hypothetical protein
MFAEEDVGLRRRHRDTHEVIVGTSAASSSSLPKIRSGEKLGSFSSSALLPLLRLLVREEALLLCGYLSPAELAELVCVASWSSKADQRKAMWRAYYVLRWGAEHGAGPSTEVRTMRSWTDDAWPAPWPLSVGFCGARSVLDHLFWFVPFIRCTLHVERPRHEPLPPPPPMVAWQVACRVRARPRGASRLLHCFVCDVLEVSPPGPEPQHFRRRWARPCANCPRFAHRRCLERRLLLAGVGVVGVGFGNLGIVGEKGATAKQDSVSLTCPELHCELCSRTYRISRRFPESFPELLQATAQEWRWVLKRCFVCILFFVWLRSLAEHYCALDGGVSKETDMLLAFTAVMMSISVSQRFHRGIQMIWNTPHRFRYFQVFGLFFLLFYMVSLRAFEPSQWEALATNRPWLRIFHEAHSIIHTSFLGTLLLASVTLLYFVTASGIIFLFWKTSLRVPTVADVDSPLNEGSSLENSAGGNQCGLCQLGLCLDNTCM